MAKFKKEVEKKIKAMCYNIDFKKKGFYYIKPINDNVLATLFFGYIMFSQKGHIFINVGIGVAYKAIEDIYFKLINAEKVKFKYTISEQLGYLMPEGQYKEWDFVEEKDNTKVYEDLFYNIQAYGFPYQKKMSNFDNLFNAYKKREPGVLNIARDRYLPILYYLKGEKNKGLSFIGDAIKRQQTPVSEKEKDELEQMAGPGGKVIIGSGIGKVDPAYLKFVEKYKKLPPLV